MAGELYRSKVRTGNLSGALKPLIDYFARKKQEEENKQYIANLFNAYKSYKDRMNKTASTGFDPKAVAESKPLQTADQSQVNDILGNFQEGGAPINPQNRNNVLSQTRGTGVTRLGQQGRLNAADEMASDFGIEQIMSPSKQMNPAIINVLANALQNQAGRLKPKEQIMDVGEGKDIIRLNTETGEAKSLYKNEKPGVEKTPQSVLLGEGSYGGKRGIKYGYIKDGKEIVTKFDEFNKGTTVNIENKLPKPEKWKEFGKVISNARETKYFDTETGKMESYEPEEINQNWDGAKNEYLSNLLPNAKIWFEDEIIKKNKVNDSDAEYLKSIRTAVENDNLTIEEAQDLIDANAYRGDLYGPKNKVFSKSKGK